MKKKSWKKKRPRDGFFFLKKKEKKKEKKKRNCLEGVTGRKIKGRLEGCKSGYSANAIKIAPLDSTVPKTTPAKISSEAGVLTQRNLHTGLRALVNSFLGWHKCVVTPLMIWSLCCKARLGQTKPLPPRRHVMRRQRRKNIYILHKRCLIYFA